jgi:hypothetical protein
MSLALDVRIRAWIAEVGMNDRPFRFLSHRWSSILALLTVVMFLTSSVAPAWAMNSVRGVALPQPLPLFPPDNWWNLDISNPPLDAKSGNLISFIISSVVGNCMFVCENVPERLFVSGIK